MQGELSYTESGIRCALIGAAGEEAAALVDLSLKARPGGRACKWIKFENFGGRTRESAQGRPAGATPG
jgi:hypothetical protein